MTPFDVFHVPQPVVDQSEPCLLERRPHAAAPVMAGHDHMFHAEHVDRVLQNRQAIQVRVDDDVRDITVDEQLAGREPDDFIGRDAAVGTPDP